MALEDISIIVNLAEEHYAIEQLGTKEKYWFEDQEGHKKLFKIGRPNTGENWAEVVSSYLAELMGIPHAMYSFGLWTNSKGEKREGVVSDSFVPKSGRLIHGNELMAKISESLGKNYPQNETYHVREHVLGMVLALASKVPHEMPIGFLNIDSLDVSDIFAGYLVFDCWIANLDRHHENWGFVIRVNEENKNVIHLAPTYDHGSSLGCRESDKAILNRLDGNDTRCSIEKFVSNAKARTPFYRSKDDEKPMLTIEVCQDILKKRQKATLYWIEKINSIPRETIVDLFNMIPEHLISTEAKRFAIEILETNKKRLSALTEGIQND